MNRILFADLELRRDDSGSGFWDAAGAALRRFGSGVRAAIERQRQRRALARLDQRLLRDIGITAEQAREEAEKPPWRC